VARAEAGEFRDRRGTFVRIAGSHDDRRAMAREPARHAEADPAIASGDDRDLAGQVEHPRHIHDPSSRIRRPADSRRAAGIMIVQYRPSPTCASPITDRYHSGTRVSEQES
jgi:hypothetical protein